VRRLVICEAAFHFDDDRREDRGKLVGFLLEAALDHGRRICELTKS
jgi:hypothetical protein